MTRTLNAENILRNTIGFDPFWRVSAATGTFPPHNIEQVTDEQYRLTLAVAGFKQDEITISLQHGVLTITGRKSVESAANFLYRGIAQRNFLREFKLGADTLVTSAVLEDGLLVIDIERVVPEEEKPKFIPITSGAVAGETLASAPAASRKKSA